MGVSPAIFESAGQRTEHYVPGSYSRSANVSSPSGVSAGNHVILAKSTGGKPLELMSFSNLADAQDVLVSGELLNAIGYAFQCSNDYTPQKVFAMRVDPATQSTLTLNSGETEIIRLKSWDYGVHCNQLKLRIDAGTAANSKKVTVVYKNDEKSIDNIVREAFSIQYIGEGENPNVTINSDKITLSATGEDEVPLVITWEDASTLNELITKINDSGYYVATLLDTDGDRKTKTLDTCSNVDVTESAKFYSNMDAFIEALKTISLIGEIEKLSTETKVIPDETDGYIYFANGTTTTPTATDWNNALAVLQTKDIQIISTPSTDSMVHALITSHCALMSNTENKKERTAILGGPVGISDSEGLTNAKGFNSKYVSYIIDSAIKTNPISGEEETIPGSILGVMLAAMESALAVNEPLTFKSVNVLGFTQYRTNSNMETLIKGGIMVVNPNPENPADYVCVRAITTSQKNNDLISCERSMVREDLYMNKDLRQKYVPSIGHTNNGSTADIIQTLKDTAADWATQGYIIPGEKGNVWDIKVKISGDKAYLTYSRYLTAPRNFMFMTAANQVYESTVEV